MAIKYKDKGLIRDGKMKCNHVDKLLKYLEDNEGLYFSIVIKILGKAKDRKSLAQLGYYFGVLVPLITDQLIADGHTWTVNFEGFHREIPYDQGCTHELLTQLCGFVGDNGAFMRLSDDDMTLARMVKFIENVLDFAIATLNMNEKALKAKRPK